jgi:hypothetical protein
MRLPTLTLPKKIAEEINLLTPEDQEVLLDALPATAKEVVLDAIESPQLEYEHAHPNNSPIVEYHNSLRPINKQLFPAKKKSPFKRSPVKTRSKTVAKPMPSQGYRAKRKFVTEKRPNP